MSLLTESEAAIKTGYSVELLRYFIKHCPKYGEDKKLSFKNSEEGMLFEEQELISYQHYLNKPWPIPPDRTRPNIPDRIISDIKEESHHSCAICGFMDNGEVAHIEAVSTSLNNSPDNLIFLCPNHHTKYDFGYKINTNISIDIVRSAKMLKRNSRQRMLRYEANATKYLRALINSVKMINTQLKTETNPDLIKVYSTELEEVMVSLPDQIMHTQRNASKDIGLTETDKILARNAGKLSKLISVPVIKRNNANLRSAAQSVLTCTEKLLIDIDETECPHCSGRGQTGLVGDICRYCHGACVVTAEEAKEYDASSIDEVFCPHCSGRGQTGLIGDICVYCGGSCVVSQEKAHEYDESEIDEVECPHCSGRGQTGLVGDICVFCGGSCVISQEKADEYDESEIDEVECPRCSGRGQTGLVGDICTFCGGSCVVSQDRADEYDESETDEIECPHCGGRGFTGIAGNICSFCDGSCVVDQDKADKYNTSDIDEVECPHCHGTGRKGFSDQLCSLCKGSCMVSEEVNDAYREQYRG